MMHSPDAEIMYFSTVLTHIIYSSEDFQKRENRAQCTVDTNESAIAPRKVTTGKANTMYPIP